MHEKRTKRKRTFFLLPFPSLYLVDDVDVVVDVDGGVVGHLVAECLGRQHVPRQEYDQPSSKEEG